MPFCPEKGQKRGKVGRAVGQNQLFCILLNIGSLDFFEIGPPSNEGKGPIK